VLEPIQKEGYDYFNAFRLTVKNKTVKPLGIDWQQSRYLFGGKPIGGFAFRNPSGQSINTPPTDTVPPAGAYLRDMVPVSLIGYQPLASSQKPGEETFSAGVIPAGENGIYLVVEQDGEKFSETLIVNIRMSEGKP